MTQNNEKMNSTVNMPGKEERRTAVENAVKQIEKDFGVGSIMRLGNRADENIDVLSTGILSLDNILGVGGLPRGHIVEIYGPKDSGRTTIALWCIAQAQKAGGFAAFIDAEHTLDSKYAEAMGVDIDELYLSQPDNGEQALGICEALVQSGAFDIVIVDSVAALVLKREIEQGPGEIYSFERARLLSQALQKIDSVIGKTNTVLVFINLLREKAGVVYEDSEPTAGGKGLKFYSSVRIEVRNGQLLRDFTDVIGNRLNIKVAKNKVAPPFKSTAVDLIYGKGISAAGDLLELAVAHNIIKRTGAWYSYDGNNIARGRENTVARLEEDKMLFDEIFGKVKVTL